MWQRCDPFQEHRCPRLGILDERYNLFRELGSQDERIVSSASCERPLFTGCRKRLYRLLLSYPLPSPHPPTRALTSLREPAFATIAKSPSTSEGTAGLVQISRLCLAVGVWAPGNEKVIGKIQGLSEDDMAELMRSIEEVCQHDTSMLIRKGDGYPAPGEAKGGKEVAVEAIARAIVSATDKVYDVPLRVVESTCVKHPYRAGRFAAGD